MYRKTKTLVVAVIILVLAVTPVGAITYGEPDGNSHPNVGLTLTDLGSPTLFPGCSGTLISSTAFLTAGHCTSFLSQLGITKTWVTFDSEYNPDSSTRIPVAGFATHPGFNPNTLFNDVGVIILAEPVVGVTPGALPPENLLGQMKAAGTLSGQTFVNVGYGATADFKGHPPMLPRDGVRRFSTSPYGGLTPNGLHLLGNHDATGEGGVCAGDSGGPQFLGQTNMLVSITSWGDNVCRSLSMAQRLDTPSVQAFLDDYVNLP